MLKLISNVTHVLPVQKVLLNWHQHPHVLYYHMVADRKPDYYYQQPISVDDFRYQLEWLKKNRFEFVSLADIGKTTNRRQVAITTDDGFCENYTNLAPVLSDYKIPATFFLINSCIDNRDLMWMNKLFAVESRVGSSKTKELVYTILRDKKILSAEWRSLKKIYSAIPMNRKDEVVNELWAASPLPSLTDFLAEHKPYMLSAQIDELLSAGFSIGGHTMTHPRCAALTLPELKREVVDSVVELSQKFNATVDYFAYPFGSRPNKVNEQELLLMAGETIFMGIKNHDEPLRGSRVWERDKMEQSRMVSLFWFSIMPLIRKFLLKPLGFYK